MDPLQALPLQVFQKICDALSLRELAQLQSLNKNWHACAKDAIEVRWEQRLKRAQEHMAQGLYTPMRLQTPDTAPRQAQFSPDGRHLTVHFVSQPPEMFGLYAYPPSQWFDLPHQRPPVAMPSVDHVLHVPKPPCAPEVYPSGLSDVSAHIVSLAPARSAIAWLSAGQAWVRDLTRPASVPVQLQHPDHHHFGGWIDFSPDGSYVCVGSLVLGSCGGVAMFDFGQALQEAC